MKAFDTIKRGLKITASIFGKVCLIIMAIVTQRDIEYENTNTGTKFNVSPGVVDTIVNGVVEPVVNGVVNGVVEPVVNGVVNGVVEPVVNGVVEHPVAATGVAVGTIGTIGSFILKCNPIVTYFTGCISILIFIVDAIIDNNKLKHEPEHEKEMKMHEKEMKMLDKEMKMLDKEMKMLEYEHEKEMKMLELKANA